MIMGGKGRHGGRPLLLLFAETDDVEIWGQRTSAWFCRWHLDFCGIGNQRQPHDEGAPFPRLALDIDCPAMDLHNPLHNCKTKPCSPFLSASRFINAIEPIEDPLALSFIDTDTSIAHTNLRPLPFAMNRYRDHPSGWSVLHRVVD